MSTSYKSPEQGIARANKIYVDTTHSQDGHSQESFWIDYNPEDRYALFLLEYTLNLSAGVNYYSVHDGQGKRIPGSANGLAHKRR